MKKKKIVNDLKFCNDLINIFRIYVECLEEYFKDEKNKEDHKELYNYFEQLHINIINAINNNGYSNE